MNWMNLQALLPLLLLPLMLVLPGAVLLTPRLTRPDIFFSFTVEPSLRRSDTGRAILRQFSWAVLLSSLFGLALGPVRSVCRFRAGAGRGVDTGGSGSGVRGHARGLRDGAAESQAPSGRAFARAGSGAEATPSPARRRMIGAGGSFLDSRSGGSLYLVAVGCHSAAFSDSRGLAWAG